MHTWMHWIGYIVEMCSRMIEMDTQIQLIEIDNDLLGMPESFPCMISWLKILTTRWPVRMDKCQYPFSTSLNDQNAYSLMGLWSECINRSIVDDLRESHTSLLPMQGNTSTHEVTQFLLKSDWSAASSRLGSIYKTFALSQIRLAFSQIRLAFSQIRLFSKSQVCLYGQSWRTSHDATILTVLSLTGPKRIHPKSFVSLWIFGRHLILFQWFPYFKGFIFRDFMIVASSSLLPLLSWGYMRLWLDSFPFHKVFLTSLGALKELSKGATSHRPYLGFTLTSWMHTSRSAQM